MKWTNGATPVLQNSWFPHVMCLKMASYRLRTGCKHVAWRSLWATRPGRGTEEGYGHPHGKMTCWENDRKMTEWQEHAGKIVNMYIIYIYIYIRKCCIRKCWENWPKWCSIWLWTLFSCTLLNGQWNCVSPRCWKTCRGMWCEISKGGESCCWIWVPWVMSHTLFANAERMQSCNYLNWNPTGLCTMLQDYRLRQKEEVVIGHLQQEAGVTFELLQLEELQYVGPLKDDGPVIGRLRQLSKRLQKCLGTWYTHEQWPKLSWFVIIELYPLL